MGGDVNQFRSMLAKGYRKSTLNAVLICLHRFFFIILFMLFSVAKDSLASSLLNDFMMTRKRLIAT